MSTKKKISTDSIIESSLAKILLCESRIEALHYAMSGLGENKNYYKKEAQSEYSAMHSFLYKELNDAYRDFFMWSNIDTKYAAKAKELARKKYLKDASNIQSYLCMEHPYVDNDFVKNEEEFIKLVQEKLEETENKEA